MMIWCGYLTYLLVELNKEVKYIKNRRYLAKPLKEKILREKLANEIVRVSKPIDPLEIVSIKRRTLEDTNKEREMGKKSQIEKDLEDFNFKNLSHGKQD